MWWCNKVGVWGGTQNRALVIGINCPIKDPSELPCPFCHVRSQLKVPHVYQGAEYHQTLTLPAFSSWNSQPPDRDEFLLFLSHPAYICLLKQPEWTKTYLSNSSFWGKKGKRQGDWSSRNLTLKSKTLKDIGNKSLSYKFISKKTFWTHFISYGKDLISLRSQRTAREEKDRIRYLLWVSKNGLCISFPPIPLSGFKVTHPWKVFLQHPGAVTAGWEWTHVFSKHRLCSQPINVLIIPPWFWRTTMFDALGRSSEVTVTVLKRSVVEV